MCKIFQAIHATQIYAYQVIHVINDYIIQLGLPVPIVAVAVGIANEHYGSENGLVID